MNFKNNAKKLVKELGEVGHGGYEEEAVLDGGKIYCSCAHCGSAYHQYVKVFSLNPIRVTISPYESYGHEEKWVKEFKNVNDLRLSIEDTMAGC